MKSLWQMLAGRRRVASDAPVAEEASQPSIIKEPPMEIVGKVLSADEFVRYVEELDFPDPLPNRIFLHHTWKPTRETWQGKSTILGMKAYYERQIWEDENGQLHEGWNAGPHLFVADDGIWLFSDLRWDGVGAKGHNTRTRHLEMVGDFDEQLPDGPTLRNTIVALGVMHERLGLDIRSLNFHRDYSTKTCPGRAVNKSWIIPQVEAWIEDYRTQKLQGAGAVRAALVRLLQDMMRPTNPNAALAKNAAQRGLLGAITREIPLEVDDQAYIMQVFGDALIVPVNLWENVQSLAEFERSHGLEGSTPLPKTVLIDGVEREVGESPHDPFPFEGATR
ncbi:MAG: peptidoglycan recognition protein family protein [Anaerolineae bacterium]